MFGVISRACHILGTIVYKQYFKDTETRTVIFYSTVISVVSSFVHLVFALRWNLLMGISDLVFIIFTDVVFGCLSLAFCVLPSLALFAKITPPGIEGTIFAFLTGIWNFSDAVMSPLIGTFVNDKYAHVTAGNLTNYYKLMMVTFISSFFGFFLLNMIPLESDIKYYREQRGELPKDEMQTDAESLLEKEPLIKRKKDANDTSKDSDGIAAENVSTKSKSSG